MLPVTTRSGSRTARDVGRVSGKQTVCKAVRTRATGRSEEQVTAGQTCGRTAAATTEPPDKAPRTSGFESTGSCFLRPEG